MAKKKKPNSEENNNDGKLGLPIDLWLDGGEFISPTFDPDVVKRLFRPQSRGNVEILFDKNSVNKIFRY